MLLSFTLALHNATSNMLGASLLCLVATPMNLVAIKIDRTIPHPTHPSKSRICLLATPVIIVTTETKYLDMKFILSHTVFVRYPNLHPRSSRPSPSPPKRHHRAHTRLYDQAVPLSQMYHHSLAMSHPKLVVRLLGAHAVSYEHSHSARKPKTKRLGSCALLRITLRLLLAALKKFGPESPFFSFFSFFLPRLMVMSPQFILADILAEEKKKKIPSPCTA